MLPKEGASVIVFGSSQWAGLTLGDAQARGVTIPFFVGRRDQGAGQKDIEALGFLNSRYVNHAQVRDAGVPPQTHAIVMSLPVDHVHDAAFAHNDLGVANVLVEKPMAQSFQDAKGLAEQFRQNGKLVISDHYLSKALPAEVLAGIDRSEFVASTDSRSVESMFGMLGEIMPITAVEARLVEKGDGANMRGWILDPQKGGGVLLDLAVHLFAVGARLHVFDSEMSIRDVRLETRDTDGLWRSVSRVGNDPRAELFADLQLASRSGAPVRIVVGKVGAQHEAPGEKMFRLTGEKGWANLDLSESSVEIELQNGERAGMKLVGTNARKMVLSEFFAALSGRRPDNAAEALTALKLVDAIKSVYHTESPLAQPVGNQRFSHPNLPTAA